MKRILAVVLVLILAALCFAACDGEGGSSLVPGSSNITSNIPSETPSDTSSELPSTPSHLPTPPPSSSDVSGEVSSKEDEDTTPTFTPIADEDRYYYKNLTDLQKEIYLILKDYIENFTTGYITLETEKGKIESIDEIIVANLALRNDHPEYFWIPNRYGYMIDGFGTYSFAYLGNGDKEEEAYLCSKEEAELMLKSQNDIVNGFISTLKPDMTDYDIELALHDWLAGYVNYSDEAAASYETYPLAYTAYGALVNGSAVCEGYAEAFTLILNRLGIESVTITGTLDGVGHKWNMVNIGGDWYHVDVTNDDNQIIEHGIDYIHRFFNLSDSHLFDRGYVIDPDFSADVMENESFNLTRPSATATLKSYYNVSGYVVKANLPSENFISLIEEAKKNGKKIFEFHIDEDLTEFDYISFIQEANTALSESDIQVHWMGWGDNDKFIIFK